jgi:YebC/PmpR family DNA-binding regulatory protein
MAGHSKWAQIKHKKAHTDAKRGKLFSGIVKEISVAARLGGGDPGGNARLRAAMDKAKEANMPMENVKRAIMKGTGELPGAAYEESVYEGYGPGGVAVYIEVLTDNKNRTVSEIRHLLSKHGGSLGETGCVAWMFDKRGYILVGKDAEEDALMTAALEAGAVDMKNDPGEDNFEIITEPEDMARVKRAHEEAGFDVSFAEVTMLPRSYVDLDNRAAEQMTRLMEALEEHDDVQNVYANFNMPEEAVEKEKLSR